MLPGRLSPAEMFPAGDSRFRVSFVQLTSGQRIRVVEGGAERSDRVIFCVHGWGCSVYSYRSVLFEFAESRDVRVVAIDLTGHGLSDKPDDAHFYTTDALTATVAEVCTAIGVNQAIFVGHSMGTAISARLAVLQPHRVRGLILAAPVGFAVTAPMRAAIMATPSLVVPFIPQLASRSIIRLVLERAFGNPSLVTDQIVDEYWAPTQFPAFTRAVRTALHTFDWHAAKNLGFDTIQAPVIVIYSTKDNLVPEATALQYKSVVPTAQFVRLEGIGHAITDEAPDAVIEAICAMCSDWEHIR